MGKNKHAFYSELIWASTGLVLLLFIGYLTDYPWLFLTIGLLIYIFWHLKQLTRLINWLENNKEIPPDALGFWGDVFRHLYRIQRHNRQRQEKLIMLLERYKESTEAMPDATIIINEQGEIEWFNSKCVRYFGLRKKHDYGLLLTNVIRSPVLWEFLEQHDKDDNFQGVLEMSAPDNERILSIRLIHYRQKYLLIARNITSMVKLKTMRKDFVANVSHELRTPLTVINGYLETLQEYLQDEPLYTSPIQLMQQQSCRMGHIVEDLLLLSKIESNEKRTLSNDFVDMHGLLSILKKEALALSNGKQSISLINSGKRWLKGDSNELQSAFSNLISNAIHYTPQGGIIIIRWLFDGQQACFAVEDNGEGIADHHLVRLTERFYRIDVGRSRATGGTGLGLAIVKHVLTHHHSQLEIDSKVGQGSVFYCKFPDKMLTVDDPQEKPASH